MKLYDHAQAACKAGATIAEAMAGTGAHLADDSWPVVKAVKQARFEFKETRTWPVRVWVRNGPGEADPFEAVADIGGVAFDLQETPDTRRMTDEELCAFTRAEVRRQIREGLTAAKKRQHTQ